MQQQVISKMQNSMDMEITKMGEKKWYVSLGDGTFVEMDERPYVFLANETQLQWLDSENAGEAPIDCTDDGAKELGLPVFESHIHIRDLVTRSHWNDDCASVTERTTPDRINL